MQNKKATIADILVFLSNKGISVDDESVCKFLELLRPKNLFEPDRSEITPSHVTMVQTGRNLQKQIRSLVSTSEETPFVSRLFCHLADGDLYSAWEEVQQEKNKSKTNALAQNVSTLLQERLIKLQPDHSALEQKDSLVKVIPIFNADRLFHRVYRIVGPLYSPAGALLFFMLQIYSFTLFYKTRSFWLSNFDERFALLNSSFIPLAIISDVSPIVHEFSHGLMCYHFGGRVRRMGVLLWFGIFPSVFTDVSAIYFMSRYRRVSTLLAGVLGNFLLWDIGMVLWYWSPPTSVLNYLGLLLCFCNFFDFLFNLVPSFKRDGYHILSEVSGIENLYDRSFSYCWQKCKIFLGFAPTKQIEKLTTLESTIFWSYVTLTVFFQGFMMLFGVRLYLSSWSIISPVMHIVLFICVGKLCESLIFLFFDQRKSFFRAIGVG